MTNVLGRRWPVGVPFTDFVIDAATNKPYVRGGFECVARPGDFTFRDAEGNATAETLKVERFEFQCPRSGKYCGSISVGLNKPPSSPSWKWDGNFDKPTLSPSINCRSHDDQGKLCPGNCGWHGFVVAGSFNDA